MEEELRNLLSSNTWNELYDGIRRDSLNHEFARVEASKPENRSLNRYRDVYPYDHSRVVLKNHPDTDYINASLVKVSRANRKYILAQGPLPSTVGHFWLLVWQQDTRAVLMLNRVMEKGQLKCHQYWPIDKGDDMVFDNVGLRLENVGSVPGDHYTVRTLRLSQLENSEDSRDILHFHYTTWPDFGVPQCPDTFLEFLHAVRDSGSLDADVGPPVVHCSAGIGRSGTFCLVDTCLVLVTKEGPENVCIRDVLLDMRKYRMGLIQTPDQLKFSYLAIAAGAYNAGLISDEVWNEISAESEISSNDSEDGSDPGVPPPLPPRSDSLKKGENALFSRGNGTEHLDNLLQELQKETIRINGKSDNSAASSESSADCKASETSTKKQIENANHLLKTDSPSKCILSNHKMEERKREMEMRRRKKEAAKASTEQKIQEMKRKSKEAEAWQKRKAQIMESFVPFCVGLAMCAIGTYYYMRS